MIDDREVIIDGVSYHERWRGSELVFRYPNLFAPEKHPQWNQVRELTYPKES